MTTSVSFLLLVWRYIQQQLARRGYLGISGMMVLLFLAASVRGGREAAAAQAAYAKAVADDAIAWSQISPDDWLSAGVRQGRWAYLPPRGSQALAEGVSKTQAASYHARVGLEPAHRLDLIDGTLSWTPALRRLGSLDVAFVVLVFLPLWALFVTYEAISGEKARGTLRLALSGSLSRWRLLSAKGLAAWLLVWIPMALALLLGTALASLVFGAQVEPGRLLAFLSLASVYLVFYTSLGMAASVYAVHPRSSLAVAMTAWVLCTFALPRAAVLVAGSLEARPSSVLHEIAKRSAISDTRRSFVEEHHSGAAPHWMVERLLVARRTLDQEQVLQYEYNRSLRSARGREERYARLTPFGLASSALLDAAGTGPSRYDRFRDQANDYRRRLTRHFTAALELARNAPEAQGRPSLSTDDARRILEDAPVFTFQEPPFAEALPQLLRCGAALACLAFLLAAAAAYQFRRYDAR